MLPRATTKENLLPAFNLLADEIEKGVPLRSFTVATRPAASSLPLRTIYVSDGGAGSVVQFSDGTNWIPLG